MRACWRVWKPSVLGGKRPWSCAGCSLGAILALDYAWRHPRQVSALVLIAPRVRMPRGLLRLQNGVFRLLPARAFAGQGMGKDQVLSLTRSMLALDLTPTLDAVCQPTLVLCGEKDRVNQSAAREIARAASPWAV